MQLKPVWKQGVVSRQAHTQIPNGTFERELGREGFDGVASHMYHPQPPTGWTDISGPLRPRCIDLNSVETNVDPLNATLVASCPSVQVYFWVTDHSMESLARNADGDLLMFVHEGNAEFFCDYGHLCIADGDYVKIPRGTMWRIETSQSFRALLIEATDSQLDIPDRGLLGTHAMFDPALLDVPELDAEFHGQKSREPWRVGIKRRNRVSTIHYPYNPLDAVGWVGDLAPVRLNIRDIRPITSHRYHLPPSVHATFSSDRFLVSTFVPRPFETAEDALKVPFFHNNDDYDEMIFYHAGNFFSRDGIGAGLMTVHPAGITHGPHPDALRNMLKQPKALSDEFALMIDSRDAIQVADGLEEIEDYVHSWRRD